MPTIESRAIKVSGEEEDGGIAMREDKEGSTPREKKSKKRKEKK